MAALPFCDAPRSVILSPFTRAKRSGRAKQNIGTGAREGRISDLTDGPEAAVAGKQRIPEGHAPGERLQPQRPLRPAATEEHVQILWWQQSLRAQTADLCRWCSQRPPLTQSLQRILLCCCSQRLLPSQFLHWCRGMIAVNE